MNNNDIKRYAAGTELRIQNDEHMRRRVDLPKGKPDEKRIMPRTVEGTRKTDVRTTDKLFSPRGKQ